MIIKQQRNLKKEFRHGHFSNVNKEEQYKKKYVQGERKEDGEGKKFQRLLY